MNEEVCVARTRVSAGRSLGLRVDEGLLPNGRQTTREVLEHPGAVAIVPVKGDGRVVLVRQYRYAVGEALLEIPAGTLGPGEDPLDAARRELQEETGYKAKRFDLLVGFYPSPGVSTEYLWVYLARELTSSEACAEEDELIEIETRHLDETPALIACQEIQDSKSIIGLMLAKDRLSRAAFDDGS